MTPIDIQVSRSKVSVEGQAYSLYVAEGGGISVLQTSIFRPRVILFTLLTSSIQLFVCDIRVKLNFHEKNCVLST